MNIKRFIHSSLLLCFFSTDVFFVQNSLASSELKEGSIEVKEKSVELKGDSFELKAFMDLYTSENKEHKIKSSSSLYSQLGPSASTDLLDSALYSSLDYQVRESIYALPGELSSRLYKYDNPAMYTSALDSLERSWAIINSTEKRLNHTDWIENTVYSNLLINAVKAWYINKNIPVYQSKLNQIKKSVDRELAAIQGKKQNYSEEEWGLIAVLLSKLKADISTLSQFYFSEQAKLYNKIGVRSFKALGDDKSFLDILSCRPSDINLDISSISEKYRNDIKEISKAKSEDKKTTWLISQLVIKTSLEKLSSPSNLSVKPTSDYLIKEISKRMFDLNNQRYRSFDRTPNSFFQPLDSVNQFSMIEEFRDQLHSIYHNTLRDVFYADQQAAFLKLNSAKHCQKGIKTKKSKTIIPNKEIKKVSPEVEKTHISKVVKKNKPLKKKESKPVSSIPTPSPAKRIAKYRVDLTSHKDIKKLLSSKGYSIAVLSTSSAKKAAEYARKYQIENDVIVYFKADGKTNKGKYIVLLGLYDANQLDGDSLGKLFERSKALKGNLVTFKEIKSDLN